MRASIALSIALVCGCTVKADTASDERAQRPVCQSNEDCGAGRCLSAFGVCSLARGNLTRLLFEVTPPASDPVYGGARFFTVADLAAPEPTDAAERGIPPGFRELNVRPRIPVSGSVTAAPEQATCLSRALSTLPVTLTFTPRERLFGVSVPSYDLATSFDEASREYTFSGLLPPGHYDVYMRPDTAALSEGCVAIPQIFRDRSIGQTFALSQPPPAPLVLTLPWRDELEGWLLDMVHPVTGEVISNRVRLSGASRAPDAPPDELRTTLYYSLADDDFITDGDQLVRLTPPPGKTAGTVLLVRSGIVLAKPGEGRLGDVFSFGSPVDFRSWVWKQDEFDTPVPGTVSFAAQELDDVADGVFTSFDGSATVNEQGEVQLTLLPGRYRVRVTPPGMNLQSLGLLAGVETSLTVAPNETGLPQVQGGQVIEVPDAVALSGRVVRDAGGQAIDGAEVRALASAPSQDLCPARGEGANVTSCDRARTPVLRKALAQDPFVPRSRSAFSGPGGNFDLIGLDCGQCEPGAGARFDLSVRPPAELGLPWLVKHGYSLYSNESMNLPLRVPVPVAHALRLTYGDLTHGDLTQGSSAAGGSGATVVPPLAGALVRVYALLDEDAKIVTDGDLPPCVAGPSTPEKHCVHSVLQVAEMRSGKDGEMLLLLPPSIE